MLITLLLAQITRPGAPLPGPAPATRNHAPGIQVELPPGPFPPDRLMRIPVTAEDPDGDRISLRLRDVPPGVVFDPVRRERGPARSELRWWPRGGETVVLEFEAEDSRGARSRRNVELAIVASGRARLDGEYVGDVTGDGRPDVVVGASQHQPGGEVRIWSGRSQPTGQPSAILHGSGSVTPSQLGIAVRLADLTGDGILDVVALDHTAAHSGSSARGALFVWAGGPQLLGTPAPTAVLLDPAADALDSLFSAPRFADVTGDGVLDLVESWGSLALGSNQHGLMVWAGGPGLSGDTAPVARLASPTTLAGSNGLVHEIADVSGDGIDDLMLTSYAHVDGITRYQGPFLWFGGAGLGTHAEPDATLGVSGLNDADRVGDVPLTLVDLSGDGVLDLVTGSPFVDIGGISDVGALFLWKGGATLTGLRAPDARLSVDRASVSDRLGESLGNVVSYGRIVLLTGDVTGDGRVDLVVKAPHADRKTFNPPTRVTDAGGLYVWKGGLPYTGAVFPSASLFDPDAHAGDQLGDAGPNAQGFLLMDVTGDAIDDIVAVAPSAAVGSLADDGKVLVWRGGPGLSGTPAPQAVLHGPSDGSTRGLGSMPIDLGDVNADGVDDLVIGSESGVDGGILVWSTGSALSGSPVPLARLTDAELLHDGLFSTSRSLHLVDLTGDGVLDIVALNSFGDVPGTSGAGFAVVWAGGPKLGESAGPRARLMDPVPHVDDLLGACPSSNGIEFVDLDDDGILDLMTVSFRSDAAGPRDAGAVHLWPGGAKLQGTPTPRVLTRAAPRADDYLGWFDVPSVRTVDWNGDGRMDLLVGSSSIDNQSYANGGSILAWLGPVRATTSEDLELQIVGEAP